MPVLTSQSEGRFLASLSFISCGKITLVVAVHKRTFYQQQIGGALDAGFDSFSVTFSLATVCKDISVNFIKIVLEMTLKVRG